MRTPTHRRVYEGQHSRDGRDITCSARLCAAVLPAAGRSCSRQVACSFRTRRMRCACASLHLLPNCPTPPRTPVDMFSRARHSGIPSKAPSCSERCAGRVFWARWCSLGQGADRGLSRARRLPRPNCTVLRASRYFLSWHRSPPVSAASWLRAWRCCFHPAPRPAPRRTPTARCFGTWRPSSASPV